MNNEEYIRKAVSLADGFEWDNDNDVYAHTQYGRLNFAYNEPILLDHIAAQLVRQVDGLTGCLELIAFDGETNIMDQANSVGCGQGNDRTMNTIKAIVDSGVLNETP